MAAALPSSLLTAPIVAGLNHLLKADGALRSRAQAHAGKRIELRAAPLPSQTLSIQPSGFVGAADPDSAPDLSIDISLAPLMSGQFSRDALLNHLQFTGDGGLAALVRDVVQCASVDIEDELAKLVGDIAAHRLYAAAAALWTGTANGIERMGQNVAEYLAHERRVLVSSARLATLAEDLRDVVAKLEALESRIDRIGDAARRMQ